MRIYENDTIVFVGDTVLIDTLEMFDNSTLLLEDDTYILVQRAFLGKSVRILNVGTTGWHGKYGTNRYSDNRSLNGSNGQNGTPGNDITMVIGIEKLGSLIVSTNGGDGGNGGNGRRGSGGRSAGERGGDGGNGGNGGDGGDAGNISFTYRVAEGIIPIFNRKSIDRHAIQITANGGGGGKLGLGGSGGSGTRRQFVKGAIDSFWIPAGEPGMKGANGPSGKKGENGKITIKKLLSSDGKD